MEVDRARKLVDDTFHNDFDRDRFVKFVRELLSDFRLDIKQQIAWKEFEDYIDSYETLGTYTDSNNNIIGVVAVKLKRDTSRDRARTMQRNFIAKYLETGRDAALVAFYGDDPTDWRFSFVKQEYRLEKSEDKIKTKKELTPVKRYSFLVGKNESNHTCQRQFFDILKNNEKGILLEQLEKTFSIDKVTKEFFQEYKERYVELEESINKILNNDKKIMKEFSEKGIDTVDFSKKLLGQIVFLYFLQKKGWLGVRKNVKTGEFYKWGTGSKTFMRELFDEKIVPYKNFFNDVLEPLFYGALATQRDNDYYSRFDCKIPFLDGGLFEPIGGYNWTYAMVPLNNSIFQRILDTFDRFNFTVKEDEPLEKEVAVDPEMLGKVFENMLEIKDRKSKGTYYTPREIVHYMCQQSIINYLEANCQISREEIEAFINTDNSDDVPKIIKDNYIDIDQLLEEVKVIDPAVGSGAFLVGIMAEIVKARNLLTTFFDKDTQEERTNYFLKRKTIENCLYGVDIDSSAIEIAKLRFWLSLVVDEADLNNVKPLPNLDHKLMVGNSLIEEFNGIRLFDDKLLGTNLLDKNQRTNELLKQIYELKVEKGKIAAGKIKGEIIEIDRQISNLKRKIESLKNSNLARTQYRFDKNASIRESQKRLIELRGLQKHFFNSENKKDKTKYKLQIDKIEWEFIEETLKEKGNEAAIKELEQFRKGKSKPFFLWKLYFFEVFQRENSGFDIVIANPPYVRVDDINVGERTLYKNNYKSAQGKYDLYYLFFETAIRLSSLNGNLVFITPNKFCAADSAYNLRELILDKNHMIEIVSTSKLNVFESASNYPVISLIKRGKIINSLSFKEATELNLVKGLQNSKNIYTLSVEKLKNIPDYVIPINTTQKKVDFVIKLYRTRGRLSDLVSVSEGLRIPSKYEQKDVGLPIVKQYQFSKYSDIQMGDYIKKNDFEKICPVKTDRFNKIMQDKILIAEDARFISATLDFNKMIPQGGIYFAISNCKLDVKFLLGIINSRLLSALYEILYAGMHMGGGYLRYRSKFLEKLPSPYLILNLNKKQQAPISLCVSQILSVTKDKDYLENFEKQTKIKMLEKEINKLVYELNGLSHDEIELVEGFYDKNEKDI